MPVDHVVVLAHGPRRTTAEAVDRVRAAVPAVTRIVVVAAVRSAARGLGTLRTPRVDVVAQVGRAGLAEALDVPDRDLMLLVHDDVHAPAAAIEALAACHRTTGAVAVPWCNDVGQPNAIGTLPPARRAGPVLRTTPTPTGPTVASHVRPSCLVADAARLRSLLHLRLTVARTVLRSTEDTLVVAPGAVVAHDSTCVGRLAPPRSPDGRPLVTAALVVRDEASMLADCLRSLDGLADRVVVCDTGSVDDTVAIARAHGAEVVERVWRDDFAWARNEVLERCRDSWFVLSVDADERVVCDAREVRRVLATDLDDAAAFTLRIDNLDPTGAVADEHLAVRLFRPDGVVWSGALHEHPVRSDGAPLELVRLEGIHLDHLGYTATLMDARGKHERNVSIARAEHRDAPSVQTAMNLARSLLAAGDALDEAEALLEAVAADATVDRIRCAAALAMLAVLRLQAGSATEAQVLARDALELVPAEDRAGRAHAEACLVLDDPAAAVAVAAWRHDRPSPDPMTASPVARAFEDLAVARAHVALDDLAAAAAAARAAAAAGDHLPAEAWVDIVSILALATDDAVATLASVGAAAGADACLDAVGTTLGRPATAALARRLLAMDVASPRLVQVALAATVVERDADALAAVVPHLGLLDAPVLERLLEVAAARGWEDGAAVLAGGLLQGV